VNRSNRSGTLYVAFMYLFCKSENYLQYVLKTERRNRIGRHWWKPSFLFIKFDSRRKRLFS